MDDWVKVLEYLVEHELLFALTCKSNLTHVRSLRKDGILPMQRRSAYLRSRELTTYMLAHEMTSVESNLMRIAAVHGCLEGMMVLREAEPPCPWDVKTCRGAAEGCVGTSTTCPWEFNSYCRKKGSEWYKPPPPDDGQVPEPG